MNVIWPIFFGFLMQFNEIAFICMLQNNVQKTQFFSSANRQQTFCKRGVDLDGPEMQNECIIKYSFC